MCDHDETYTTPEHRAHRHFRVADELVILHFPEAHAASNYNQFAKYIDELTSFLHY